MLKSQQSTLLGISLVVCRNSKGQYLTILENGNQGWWLPGGLVDPPETFEQAAIRETKEEASIDVVLKGILRVENSLKPDQNHLRMRVIYYAEPIDENQIPKQKPDRETQQARWVDYKDLPSYSQIGPGWRGKELLEWSKYIENGGVIMPLSFFALEGEDPIIEQAFYKEQLPLSKQK
ncbi:unnamed protein product [Paramecium primaurelia]|uniref:Nudix hydrolase domain-containing protein n=1 Tax=Paramecium primaurelia TaxID=5886 RepID=A0A8S1M956_PARPR|nr:unnamed protein product [Paramecium primaurelia]